ncbi:MAG TPA: lytic murein transglycosylase [Hyphomicrobiaceae bacterium]|nr:lytic murein transglycosylase [Hyphomicrobiaceae bacterium]
MASELPNALDARFRAFLVDFRVEALRRGVAAAVFDRATAGLTADPLVVALAAAQPEHLKTPRDYLETIVSEARIEAGRAQIAPLGDTLRAIENAYGVDRHVLIALWGVETNYGSAMGDHGVVRSLSTLAVEDGRRATFWRNELLAALRILDRGDINPERMTGSWAGAMGHTQFMPSTYMAHAVDFDGDGRRNIWGSAPDALASAASYLRASGWRRSEPWGLEVTLPQGFDYTLSAPDRSQPPAAWERLGVGPPSGAKWPKSQSELQLVLPAGARGPAFLVTPNFRALLSYNPALTYALTVGHLADRIAGGAPIVGPWPVDEVPLGRSEREELQRRLVQRGFDTGGVDGIIGDRTRGAIRTYQRDRQLPEDGHPSFNLLERLRHDEGG